LSRNRNDIINSNAEHVEHLHKFKLLN